MRVGIGVRKRCIHGYGVQVEVSQGLGLGLGLGGYNNEIGFINVITLAVYEYKSQVFLHSTYTQHNHQ